MCFQNKRETMKNFKSFIKEYAVSVPSKKDTMDIDRKKMPQIKSADLQDFFKFLKDKKISTVRKTVDSSKLKASQGQFDKEKVKKALDDLMAGNLPDKPIVVSKDGYVIDGHHRWLAYVNAGKDMDVFEVNVKAKELISLMSEYPKSFNKQLYEAFTLVCEQDDSCPLVTSAQLKAFEDVVDKLFKAYKIDFDFGKKHFRDRMADERNKPCINLKELAEMVKKLYMQMKKNGNTLTKFKDTEIVLKDLQSQLNMPIAIEYDRQNDELDVIAKTIMRKKDFKTPNQILRV